MLSEADPAAQADTEALRLRLDELRADWPEYMRAAAEIIRAMRSGNNARNPQDTTFSRGSIASSRPAAEPAGPRPYSSRSPTSDAASGVYARSRRDNTNPSQETIPIASSQDDSATYSTARRIAIRDESREVLNSARRFPSRDDGSASTVLGRHVAARAAATARDRPAEGPRSEPPLREIPLSERTGLPRRRPTAVPGSTPATRPAGARIAMTPLAARQFAQYEATFRRLQNLADSEGSETEVDDSLTRWAGRVRDHGARIRPRREPGRPPGDPPDLEPVSSNTSSEGTSSGSNSGSPPLGVERSPRQRNLWELMMNEASQPSGNARNRRVPPAQVRRSPDENDTSMWDRPQERSGTSGYRNVVETEEGRTYHIRRRLNADGEEQVHRISSDMMWVDEINGMAASMREEASRQTQLRQSQARGSETDLPPLNMDQPLQTTIRRRRGWGMYYIFIFIF